MKRKILAILAGILLLGGMVAPNAMASGTTSCPGTSFLGLRSWYYGLTNSNCQIDSDAFKGDEMKTSIWTIVLNIMYDLMVVVGILAVGFIIYGGYMYMTAGGDPGRAAKAQKSLYSAIIGLIISLLATTITNFIISVVTGGTNRQIETPGAANEVLTNGINTAYAVAGIVAVGFIVYAGAHYMTAMGDPGKIKKAHNTILYAVIGLLVVLLAAAITNFVMGNI